MTKNLFIAFQDIKNNDQKSTFTYYLGHMIFLVNLGALLKELKIYYKEREDIIFCRSDALFEFPGSENFPE